MGMHIVMVGNPVGGFRYYGPFKTSEDAIYWADRNVDDLWWAVPLEEPAEETNV